MSLPVIRFRMPPPRIREASTAPTPSGIRTSAALRARSAAGSDIAICAEWGFRQASQKGFVSVSSPTRRDFTGISSCRRIDALHQRIHAGLRGNGRHRIAQNILGPHHH